MATTKHLPPKQKVEIVEMDRFFLYLPVHYACARGFFGYVPSQYDVVIRESRDRTDESAYKELTNRIDPNKNVWFALCDPTFVLKKRTVVRWGVPRHTRWYNYQCRVLGIKSSLSNDASFS